VTSFFDKGSRTHGVTLDRRERPTSENKIAVSGLPPAARTLLIPLAHRALENDRPDALLKDEEAAALLARFDEDYARLTRGQHMEGVCIVMRARQLDSYARHFAATHPEAEVVDLGCGLDTRPRRLQSVALRWYGLDFPEVIALRESWLPKGPNETLIAGSIMDFSWFEAVGSRDTPKIFLAEGVLPYLEAGEVRRLILALAHRFPGAEMAFDAINRFSLWIHRLTHAAIRRSGAHLGWWLKDSRELEAWSPWIRVLEEWSYFDQAEPRLKQYRWMRHIKAFSRANRLVHLSFASRAKARQ